MAQVDADSRPLKLTVNHLPDEHREIFSRALRNVITSDPARTTLAQIIDGLPLSAVEADHHGGSAIYIDHPVVDHNYLCPGVLQRLQDILKHHDITRLKFDSTLVHVYNGAARRSRAFQTRLVEIIAVAVHQIAVELFRSEPTFHRDDGKLTWEHPKDSDYWNLHKTMPATLFRHPQYCDYDQYPEGVADGVGYWAENRIFGGVVLFDRRHPNECPTESNDLEIDPNAIYLHSDGSKRTYRIFQLLDGQRQDLLEFLLPETTPPVGCPIPIHATADNLRRIDPEEPIAETGVYRDLWERKPLRPGDSDWRTRDVCDEIDFPTLQQFCDAGRRALRRQDIFDAEEALEDSSRVW